MKIITILLLTFCMPCQLWALVLEGSSQTSITKDSMALPNRVTVQILVGPNKKPYGTGVIIGKGKVPEKFEVVSVTHNIMEEINGVEQILNEQMWIRVPHFRMINGEMTKDIILYPVSAAKHNQLSPAEIAEKNLPPEKRLVKLIVEVPPGSPNPVDVVGNVQISFNGEVFTDPASKGSMGEQFSARDETAESIYSGCSLPKSPLKKIYKKNRKYIRKYHINKWFSEKFKKDKYCFVSFDGSLGKHEQLFASAFFGGMHKGDLKHNAPTTRRGGSSGGGVLGRLPSDNFELVALNQGAGCHEDLKEECKLNDLNRSLPFDNNHFNFATPAHYLKGSDDWPEYRPGESRAEAMRRKKFLAEKGEAWDQLQWGELYFIGQKVQQDFKEAYKWIQPSAEQGLSRAQSVLGLFFEKGLGGIPQDFVLAYKWFLLAADDWIIPPRESQNCGCGDKDLNRMEEKMTPPQITKALELAHNWRLKKQEERE